jgi:excisionase family DNA binding protein
MSTTDRAALRRLAEAMAPGAAVSVPREWLLELLSDTPEGPDYTVAEVAELFGRSESTVRTWCEERRFEGAYKLSGKSWRIPRAAVPAFRAAEGQRSREPSEPVSLGAWRATASGESGR